MAGLGTSYHWATWKGEEKKECHFLSISMGPQLLFILSAPPRNPHFLPTAILLRPQKLFFGSPLILRIYAGLGTATDKRSQSWRLPSGVCKWLASWLAARKVEMKESCRCLFSCFFFWTHPADCLFCARFTGHITTFSQSVVRYLLTGAREEWNKSASAAGQLSHGATVSVFIATLLA